MFTFFVLFMIIQHILVNTCMTKLQMHELQETVEFHTRARLKMSQWSCFVIISWSENKRSVMLPAPNGQSWHRLLRPYHRWLSRRRLKENPAGGFGLIWAWIGLPRLLHFFSQCHPLQSGMDSKPILFFFRFTASDRDLNKVCHAEVEHLPRVSLFLGFSNKKDLALCCNQEKISGASVGVEVPQQESAQSERPGEQKKISRLEL